MKQKNELVKGKFGTSSLILGLIGLFICPFILSILGIIFGAIGMCKNQKYSVAGLILSIIGIFWGFVLVTLWLVFLVAFTSM